jgi:DNA-binding NarL/FixJ family response regulator
MTHRGCNEERAVRIIIVDDHEIVREGLIATLAASAELTVVGAAATGRDAVTLARRAQPDVALVDLRLPDMSGDDVCRELLRMMPSMAVVILSTYLSEEAVRSALRAGAAGYVTKAAGVSKLREVLHGIRHGSGERPQTHQAPQIVKQLHDLVSEREGGLRATPQQERVLELAAQGLTNREVGERLFISESTVRFHIQKLKESTCARTRTELIAKAIHAGLIPPAPEDLRVAG